MRVASFEVIKDSVESLVVYHNTFEGHHWSSVWNILLIIVMKLGLLVLCQRADEEQIVVSTAEFENIEKLTATVMSPFQ
jgi:hypothetical protein